MSIILEGAILPPHLLQDKPASWPSPYYPQYYPAPGSSPPSMSPQSHHSYMPHLPESPLPSQDLNSQPTPGWCPSISAPEYHSEVCTSPLLRDRLLIYGCLDQLCLVSPLCASAYINYQPIAARPYASILNEGFSFRYAAISSHLSRHGLLPGLSSTRIYTSFRRASVRRKKCASSVHVSF